MEATIEIKESEYDDHRHDHRRTLFGRYKMVVVPLGKKKRSTVYLYLTPSEEERAIILQYKLDELAVETEPKYTAEYMQDYEYQQRQLHSTLSEEMFKNIVGVVMAEMRQQKNQTLLNRYFDNPYTKDFDLRQDAHTYVDKIENEILPLIKTQIDYYRLESMRRDKRTITL